jgi:hypothetical protein
MGSWPLRCGAGAPVGRVQLDRAEGQGGAGGGLRAAQQRAQARQQLGQLEGLDHVVVGAQVQALHAVVQRVARGEDQHRHVLAGHLAAQAPRELQAVHVGQADVDDGGVEHLGAQHFLGPLAAADPVDRIAGVGQPQLDAAGHHHVVFDQAAWRRVWQMRPLRQALQAACKKWGRSRGRSVDRIMVP